MICVHCGSIIPEDSVYCPNCGKPVGDNGSDMGPGYEIDGAILYKTTRMRSYYISLKEPRASYEDAVAMCGEMSAKCHLPSVADVKGIIDGLSEKELADLNAKIVGQGGDPLAKPGEERFYWIKDTTPSSDVAPYYSALTGNSGVHSKHSELSVRPMFYISKSPLKL